MAQDQTDEDAPGTPGWDVPPRPQAPISMIVNLRAQRAYVYRDGVEVRTTPISSGKPGYRTPTGTFTVLEKQRVHHSNKYDNAPMPYMQRLTWYGVALHGGHVPGFPASHGCIRLPMGFARWLYSEPTMGMTVVITNQSRHEHPVQMTSSADPPATVDTDNTDYSQ
jgi:lipoprotein-anchoring transpeptidase ErfK/SrfK